MMTKSLSLKTFLILGIVLGCGFYLRIESVIETKVLYPISKDAKRYYMYAYNLRFKHTYSSETGNPRDLSSPVKPDSLRSPGYPLFLTPFINGLPDENTIACITFSQAVLSTLTIIVSFLFFRTFLPLLLAAVASGLVAMSPHLIVINSYILTEALFCFFILLMGYLMSLFLKNPTFPMAITVGAIMGIANLVRPSLQYFPVFMVFFLIWHYNSKKGIYLAFSILLGFFLAISPWLIRNQISMKGESTKKLKIGFVHHGIYPDFMFDGKEKTYGFPYQFDPRYNEINKSISSLTKEIIRRFHEKPIQHIKWFLLKKPIAFWSWNLIQGRDAFVYAVSTSPYFYKRPFQWTHRIMYAVHNGLVLFCWGGIFSVWMLPSKMHVSEDAVLIARFTSLFLIYFILLHMIGSPFPRYSVPLRPYLYGMAMFFSYLLFGVLNSAFTDYKKL